MEKLSSHNWKAFAIKEVFHEIKRGKRLKKADHIDGFMPYVSSTSQNNGIDQFIGNKNMVRKFRDCITIANSGSVGSSFYHSYEFVASDHVTQLKRSGCNKYSYLFLASILKRLSEKYSFNREINDERIEKDMIMLPVTDDGKPDWAFMEAYMQQVEQAILKPTIEQLKARITDAPKPIGGG